MSKPLPVVQVNRAMLPDGRLIECDPEHPPVVIYPDGRREVLKPTHRFKSVEFRERLIPVNLPDEVDAAGTPGPRAA